MAVKAYFNAQGCRNRDGFKLILRMNRIKAAPMFQFAFVAVLFQFRARKPQLSPLLQFPNRRQTPQVTPSLSPYILLTKYKGIGTASPGASAYGSGIATMGLIAACGRGIGTTQPRMRTGTSAPPLFYSYGVLT